MRKLFLLISLLLSTNTFSNEVPRVKVFQDGDTVRVGIYLGCYYVELSKITTPNYLITQSNNHFEIILSLHSTPYRRCSPPPPEYIDQGRDYYNLGTLPAGEYTVTVKYVMEDASLPPESGVEVYELASVGFSAALAVPALNKYSVLILILLMGLVSFKLRRKLFN